MREAYPIAAIKYWLEHYDLLASGDCPAVFQGRNTGAKPLDGMRAALLNKVLLDEAVKQLPQPEQVVLVACYVDREPKADTCKRLGITKQGHVKTLYGAVSMVWHTLNCPKKA